MRRIFLHIPVYLPEGIYKSLRSLRQKIPRKTIVSNGRNLKGDRDVEWAWIYSAMPNGPGNALDFGPGGSSIGLAAAQKGFQVTAIDLNKVQYPYEHPAVHFIYGDLLELQLPESHFDLVINCSTVEHVGLAGRYGTTKLNQDGDLEAMRVLRHVLKPSGVMLLTVPVGLDEVFSPICRVYGEKRLPELVRFFEIEKEAYWIKDDVNQWILTDRQTALNSKASAGSWDPLENIYALGCFVLKPGIEQ